MKVSFTDLLNRALTQRGYSSLRDFYERQKFSFSYEYLRQIFIGYKVPSPPKIAELARALRLEEKKLRRLAADAKVARSAKEHYRKLGAPSPRRLGEKLKRYGEKGTTDMKVLRMMETLGPQQKEQVLEYIRFLRKQWRKQSKKARSSSKK